MFILKYQKLQKERSLSLLDFVPKCYYTRETDSDEVLALENIKPYGFQLHPKEVKMDQAHIRLVLNRLAQWHALSFSLKDRYFEEFKKLHENHKVSVWKTVFDSHVGKIIEYSHKSLYKILEETGQIEILNKFKANCKCLDSKDIIYSLINEDKDEKHAVLIHGDCWNSNFMFQYKDEDHSQPTKIQLLDFQVSSLRSPIIDVSQFIYTTASAEELKNIKAHLTYYYNELSKYIEALGSDPQELFTPKDFQEQWHKYSAHGVLIGLIAPIFIHLNSVSLENETVILELLPKMVAKPEFIKRVTDIAKCFATFEF
ncbi:uncharacterized protein LOC126742977 isoform X2 [Anthonomus grandis grandis]|uniref:uncharacterized protein LOC126742977 isoform X2 n=1 Tax=Anthonomus grandis grandis TaxID=2921223 RepID=UPI00216537F7|nr:uncharacterized protein LOC126742977 isoform X2 [Anthonomus grandis grandis]